MPGPSVFSALGLKLMTRPAYHIPGEQRQGHAPLLVNLRFEGRKVVTVDDCNTDDIPCKVAKTMPVQCIQSSSSTAHGRIDHT